MRLHDRQGLADATPCLWPWMTADPAGTMYRMHSPLTPCAVADSATARSAARACAGLHVLTLLLLLLVAGTARGQDDTRRLLEQDARQQSWQREQQLLEQATAGDRPILTVDGKTYRVENTANDVGQALYLMLAQRQWTLARGFLQEYRQLPDRDPLLLHYAQAMLYRADGEHALAIAEFSALLALQPDFMLARLELARTLFEDQQDVEARALFNSIQASLPAQDTRTAGVRETVALFQQALRNRSRIEGSFALGPQWNDNLNRSSASRICLYQLGGECLLDRHTPAAVSGSGIEYDATLGKRAALVGHHGVYMRSLLYGQVYRDAGEYNEASFAAQAGYSYRSASQRVSLAPTFDYYRWGRQTLYAGWGVHAEWSWTPRPRHLLRVEADSKALRYRNDGLADNYDGSLNTLSLTYFNALSERWTLFAGGDVADSGARQQINAYLQRGLRAGAVLQWPQGLATTAMLSLRERRHHAFNAALEKRREDIEQNYTLVIKASRWAMVGFVPVLTLRHTVSRSNVGWLYSYDKNVASLKLERAF